LNSHVRFLQFSGCRFDSPFWEGPEKWGTIRNQDVWSTFNKVLSTCQTENIDLLFVTGNLFEQDYVRKSTVERVAKSFESLRDTKVFVIPGEKDPLVATSAYRLTVWPNNVHLFSNEINEVKIPSLNVTVYGAGWTAYQNESTYLNDFQAKEDGTLSIMLLHTEVASLNKTKGFIPLTEDQIEASHLSYLALGHQKTWSGTHKAGTTLWADSGVIEARSFKDIGPHGIIVGELGENFAHLEFRELGQRQYIQKSYELQSGIESFVSSLLSDTNPEERERDLFRIRLSGITSDIELMVQQIQGLLADKFRFIDISPVEMGSVFQLGHNPLTDNLPAKKILSYDTLEQLFNQKIAERLTSAISTEERDHWTLVKKIGLTALEQGRIHNEN
jgi:DNA repair protein SbcD/Mre11